MENLKINNFNQEKKLPSNIEAEQALLGSVLVNNDIIDEVSIGHAIITESLIHGLDNVLSQYIKIIR